MKRIILIAQHNKYAVAMETEDGIDLLYPEDGTGLLVIDAITSAHSLADEKGAENVEAWKDLEYMNWEEAAAIVENAESCLEYQWGFCPSENQEQ